MKRCVCGAFSADHEEACVECGASLPSSQRRLRMVLVTLSLALSLILGWLVACLVSGGRERQAAASGYDAMEALPTIGDLVGGYLATIRKPSNNADTDTDKLRRLMPYCEKDFSVEYEDGAFTVSLFAILNHSWQYEQYRKDVAAYKKEALRWIKSSGVDPAKIKIRYIPEPPDS